MTGRGGWSLSLPRASDTKEIQKMPWARGYPSRVGTEAGRQGLPFSPVVLVFSISANTRNDVHKRKANNTWEGLLFPRVAFIKAFLQACERGPFLGTVAEGKRAAGTPLFPFHQLESILFPRAALWRAAGSGEWRLAHGVRAPGPVLWGRRPAPHPPADEAPRLRKFKHLLHGDGVEKPGIEALGGERRESVRNPVLGRPSQPGSVRGFLPRQGPDGNWC